MREYEWKDGLVDLRVKVSPSTATVIGFLVTHQSGQLLDYLSQAVRDYTRKLKLARREMEEEIEVLERLLSGELEQEENEQQSVDEVLGLDAQQSDLIIGSEDLKCDIEAMETLAALLSKCVDAVSLF